jgi:hypothetical protein
MNYREHRSHVIELEKPKDIVNLCVYCLECGEVLDYYNIKKMYDDLVKFRCDYCDSFIDVKFI